MEGRDPGLGPEGCEPGAGAYRFVGGAFDGGAVNGDGPLGTGGGAMFCPKGGDVMLAGGA